MAKDLAWGFVIAVVSAAVVGGLAHLTGYENGRVCGIRETAALVNYVDGSSGRSRRRIILSWFRNRRLAEDWSWTLLVCGNSAGYFFHWPVVGGAANILIAFAAGLILTGFYLWRRDLAANMIGHGLVDFAANVVPRIFS